jgi:3-deoxy-manno-octulosonate cytidylyltransferase (CMP-KDO synthetase)
LIVIPARWSSSRFPGKVLAPLGNTPLVVHACRRAAAVDGAEVVVATDSDEVREAVERAGFEAEMTRADHASGTDRVAEVAERRDASVVLGLQADEPFVEPGDLAALIRAVDPGGGGASLATLWYAADLDSYLDPNVVKLVCDADGRALYFSRSPLPYERTQEGALPRSPRHLPRAGAKAHVGVYAWQRDALLRFKALPASPLERTEGLEQLRALEAGWRIVAIEASSEPLGVDTPDDLRRAEARLSRTGRTA